MMPINATHTLRIIAKLLPPEQCRMSDSRKRAPSRPWGWMPMPAGAEDCRCGAALRAIAFVWWRRGAFIGVVPSHAAPMRLEPVMNSAFSATQVLVREVVAAEDLSADLLP